MLGEWRIWCVVANERVCRARIDTMRALTPYPHTTFRPNKRARVCNLRTSSNHCRANAHVLAVVGWCCYVLGRQQGFAVFCAGVGCNGASGDCV